MNDGFFYGHVTRRHCVPALGLEHTTKIVCEAAVCQLFLVVRVIFAHKVQQLQPGEHCHLRNPILKHIADKLHDTRRVPQLGLPFDTRTIGNQ